VIAEVSRPGDWAEYDGRLGERKARPNYWRTSSST
jgi:hypothetical protein